MNLNKITFGNNNLIVPNNYETTFQCNSVYILVPQKIFVENIKQNVNIPLQYTKGNKNVSRVFVIAGSGKSMTEEILSAGCDCVITGESSYHDMLDLKEMGISTICLGHDESEKISVETLAKLVNDRFDCVKAVPFVEESLVKFI